MLCFYVCIELCAAEARTLVAILWLNSEWHWLCLKERETEMEGERLAAGPRPNSVCKEILDIQKRKRGGGKKIISISEACIIFHPSGDGSSKS